MNTIYLNKSLTTCLYIFHLSQSSFQDQSLLNSKTASGNNSVKRFIKEINQMLLIKIQFQMQLSAVGDMFLLKKVSPSTPLFH